jgi:hypothetical protein
LACAKTRQREKENLTGSSEQFLWIRLCASALAKAQALVFNGEINPAQFPCRWHANGVHARFLDGKTGATPGQHRGQTPVLRFCTYSTFPTYIVDKIVGKLTRSRASD